MLDWKLKGDTPNSQRLVLEVATWKHYSLVKLHIFQIKKSLTHDQKEHHGREHS